MATKIAKLIAQALPQAPAHEGPSPKNGDKITVTFHDIGTLHSGVHRRFGTVLSCRDGKVWYRYTDGGEERVTQIATHKVICDSIQLHHWSAHVYNKA